MSGGSTEPTEIGLHEGSDSGSHSDLFLKASDLLPGDVLLYRPDKPHVVQRKISDATNSPFTHAAIYVGNGQVAESGVPSGVRKSALGSLVADSRYVAVLRSQLGFGAERQRKLGEFVTAVVQKGRLYDLFTLKDFTTSSAEYFEGQLEFVRENYGNVTSSEDFARKKFICSAFVVACFAVVGIIGDTAQAAYQPDHFSPGHIAQDPTFGWLLGYLVPQGGSIPADDPLLTGTMLWRDCQDGRWW